MIHVTQRGEHVAIDFDLLISNLLNIKTKGNQFPRSILIQYIWLKPL